ncbi:hypothetical protein BVRB_3g053940 [Beta vulgaris subsp. vulgaris]|nr:hypothetical protein BVRB_3g053940 [Beta vulgaris subsp. vulgaris]
MSSSQVVQNHQAALDELVKHAQSKAAAREVNPQEQLFLMGHLRNNTSGPMTVHAEYVWSGDFITKYPEILVSGVNAQFEQVSKIAANGIKTAVVYSGRVVDGQSQCGWLVAWSNPEDIQAKKVYVDCGAISKFDNIDWKKIDIELSNSGSNASRIDPFTRTAVHARILPPVAKAVGDGILVVEYHG